jgi:hypothetical protein
MKEKEIEKALEKISKEIESMKEQVTKKGMEFSSPTIEQLKKKLKSVNTPFIYGTGYSYKNPLSNPCYFAIGLHNPDPIMQSNIFAYLFFGPADIAPDIGTALLSAYDEFPKLYQKFPNMPSGDNEIVNWGYYLPKDTQSPVHIANVIVFQRTPWSVPLGRIIQRISQEQIII